MKKIDARTLPNTALEEKRRQAVKLHHKGMTNIEIAEIVEVHRDTISRWLSAYRKQGAMSLKLKQRGRHAGSGRRLSADQEKAIKQLLVDKSPDQLKLPFALWTRQSVRWLVRERLGIDLPIRTVGHYLKRWGMTPQKPVKQAYEQQPKQVQGWLDETYPQIKRQAKQEDAEIYWGDETGLRNDCQHERGYAPKGKTPVIRLNANRTSHNMISAITNQGKVRFKLFEGGMNTDILIDFMKRLIKDANRKVILILDNLPVHHAKVVKTWLSTHQDQIEVYYLPSYSPELNPDEYLNCDLKAGVHSGSPARTKTQLKQKITSHMRMLQKKPARVRGYFQHEKISYAA